MKAKKTFRWIVVLALLAGGGYGYYRYHLAKEKASKTQYDRATAALSNIRVVVESTGEIQPRNRLDVKPPIGGRLEELMVEEGDAVEAGQIIGWVSSTERATLLDAARAISNDEYEYWQKLYKPTPLISPLKGTVIDRKFEPGQSIEAKDAVVVIADDLIVVANLDETDIGLVKTNQQVVVRLEAYPDKAFSGVVEKLAYDATTVSSVTMYSVDVRPENMPSFARSGMTANLEFVIQEKHDVLAVPAAAIQQESRGRRSGGAATDGQRKKTSSKRSEGGGKPGGGHGAPANYVLVPSDNPDEPAKKPVEVGISDGQNTEILSGMQEGEVVLIPKIKVVAASSAPKPGSPFMPTSTRGSGGGRR